MNTKKMSIEPFAKFGSVAFAGNGHKRHKKTQIVPFVPFVAIRVHSWFAFMDDRLFFLE